MSGKKAPTRARYDSLGGSEVAAFAADLAEPQERIAHTPKLQRSALKVRSARPFRPWICFLATYLGLRPPSAACDLGYHSAALQADDAATHDLAPTPAAQEKIRQLQRNKTGHNDLEVFISPAWVTDPGTEGVEAGEDLTAIESFLAGWRCSCSARRAKPH